MEQREIETWVSQAKRGNEEAVTKLFAQYKGYIYKSAYQYNIKNHEANDLVQLGYLALLKAIKNYKTGSNTFTGYALRSIKNTLLYTSRQNAKYDGVLSLNYPVFHEQDSKAEFEDCIESQDNIEERVLNSQELLELKRAVSRLPKEDINLINMVYYDKTSLKNYADKSGVSYFQAARKRDKILKTLNNSMRIN